MNLKNSKIYSKTMENLANYLIQNGYIKIRFKISKTNHLVIRVKINGVWGDFILDTGASNSCIHNQDISFFKIKASESSIKASGAGTNEIPTQLGLKNTIQLGRWRHIDLDLIIIDLSHVNNALKEYKTKTVNGIIGADVLQAGSGIIDYKNCFLYLKKGNQK